VRSREKERSSLHLDTKDARFNRDTEEGAIQVQVVLTYSRLGTHIALRVARWLLTPTLACRMDSIQRFSEDSIRQWIVLTVDCTDRGNVKYGIEIRQGVGLVIRG
jgi:hypothetical protein